MKIVFLEAAVPLTKKYTKTANGITKTPYPFVWEFASHEEQFNNLSQLEVLLKKHAALNHCALKGTIARPLNKESRAGSTDTNSTTEWLVLDLDGLPDTIEVKTAGDTTTTMPLTIDLFLEEMGLGNISYIVQWSASYGISDKKLRAHVFMLLDKPYAAPLLKQWLIQKNHEVPLLNQSMGLTKTGNTISWPLDISACQNDKLIYIAPPVLKGIKDPLGKEPRIKLIKKKYDLVSLNNTVNTSTKNRELNHKKISELREAAGLPARKFKYKVVGSQEVMLQPDESVITDMKVERGFVYFNLNGGDSWAYYHPENNPDYILNFKGEPAYLTKELLPDYWQQITGSGSSTRQSSDGVLYLAFLDRRTGVYWRGTYDQGNDILDINPAKNETQLRHFAKQYGVPIGDFVPEWDLVFDPADLVRVDVHNRVVNRFQPSSYMLNAGKAPKVIPSTIAKVISHALGGDKAIVDHFINWLATIVQTRTRTRTAWVLHGTEGTGKGILINKILRPIFGAHVATRRMEELSEKYNHFMENSFIVFVDEVQTRALQNEQGVMAKLRNFITEEMVPIRQMYSNAIEVPNYTNWIFSSNMPDPVTIKKDDRRFNVGKYQPDRLYLTDDEVDKKIPNELQAFYNYLHNFKADYELAGRIIDSHDRDILISISENSVDTVSAALMDGTFDFFIDQLPTDDSHKRNSLMLNRVADYMAALKNIIGRTDPATGKCNITREELRVLFDYCVGNMPTTPNKFTSLLKHHRIHLEPVWVGEKTVRGMKVQWQDYREFAYYLEKHFGIEQPKVATKKTTTKKGKVAA